MNKELIMYFDPPPFELWMRRILVTALYVCLLFYLYLLLRWMYVPLPGIAKEHEFKIAHVIQFTINPLNYSVHTHGNPVLDAETLKVYDKAYYDQLDPFEIIKYRPSTFHILDSSTVKRIGTNETQAVKILYCKPRNSIEEVTTSQLILYDTDEENVQRTKHELYQNGITVVDVKDGVHTHFSCSAYCKDCKKSFEFTKEVKRK